MYPEKHHEMFSLSDSYVLYLTAVFFMQFSCLTNLSVIYVFALSLVSLPLNHVKHPELACVECVRYK